VEGWAPTEPDEPAVEGPDVEHEDREDGTRRRSRSAIIVALLVLLMLLLCTVNTVWDTWTKYGPEKREFIVRNLDCVKCHSDLLEAMNDTAVHDPFLKKECGVCHTPHGRELEMRKDASAQQTWQRARTLLEWLPLKWALGAWDGVAGAADAPMRLAMESSETTTQVGPESELILPLEQLCWTCHGDLADEKHMAFQHNPFARDDCMMCHNPHSSDYRVLLTQDERDLCVTCHPIADEMSLSQQHPPFEGRYCTNCHQPHASEYEGILVDNQRDLCFQCHPTVGSLSMKAVQHQPYANDNCTGCHEPHASDYVGLLVKDQPAICYDCHKDVARDFEQASHHPVGTLDLNCTPGCHDPHATDYSGLLFDDDNGICYDCHQSPIAVTYEASAHKETPCWSCHRPHGSKYAPLLQKRNPDLCLGCHTRYEGGNQHPVRPVLNQRRANGVFIAQPVTNSSLTCTSQCHKPHGTMYPRMLTYPYLQDGLCIDRCHPFVGVSF